MRNKPEIIARCLSCGKITSVIQAMQRNDAHCECVPGTSHLKNNLPGVALNPQKGYDVFVYATIKIKVERVMAGCQEEAIKKAVDQLLPDLCRDRLNGYETEYADELTAFLVDDRDDEDFENSMWFCADGKTPGHDPDKRMARCVLCGRLENEWTTIREQHPVPGSVVLWRLEHRHGIARVRETGFFDPNGLGTVAWDMLCKDLSWKYEENHE